MEWRRFLPQVSSEAVQSRFAAAYAGKDVCVSGAGGYIGSALVKALAGEGPRSLTLLDSSEYGLFEMQRWMAAEYPRVSCAAVLGSVCDAALVGDMLRRFQPRVVFHAAAFKHVGMLERNPFVAIENNALGSYWFGRAAAGSGVAKFVLISTDKAANAHSVMGVSKRLAELFCPNAIRLGNVIGSPGSVVPLFLEQIENGRPVGVSHAEASRYFLTRGEAVDLVLAAGLVDFEGMVSVPEFQDPVGIAELARFLIGSRDLAIRFTGLQPGEKVSEDWIGYGELEVGKAQGPLRLIQTVRLAEESRAVQRLTECLAHRDVGALVGTLRSLVPEYVPSKLMLESAAVVT
jgi:FlaA1/EpsC-like NDP-sugar epimerase